jgi:hypothetical protein
MMRPLRPSRRQVLASLLTGLFGWLGIRRRNGSVAPRPCAATFDNPVHGIERRTTTIYDAEGRCIGQRDDWLKAT